MVDEMKGKTDEAGKQEKADAALIAEACGAYGIGKQYVLAATVRDGVATIVTHGGAKVRYRAGDKVEARLTRVQATGIPPEAPKAA